MIRSNNSATPGDGRRFIEGNGSPNGAVVGSRGDIYAQKDGTRGNTFWMKDSGDATNTGWVITSLVKVSSTDTVPDFLNGKITGADGVVLLPYDSGSGNVKMAVSLADTYLPSNVVGSPSVIIDKGVVSMPTFTETGLIQYQQGASWSNAAAPNWNNLGTKIQTTVLGGNADSLRCGSVMKEGNGASVAMRMTNGGLFMINNLVAVVKNPGQFNSAYGLTFCFSHDNNSPSPDYSWLSLHVTDYFGTRIAVSASRIFIDGTPISCSLSMQILSFDPATKMALVRCYGTGTQGATTIGLDVTFPFDFGYGGAYLDTGDTFDWRFGFMPNNVTTNEIDSVSVNGRQVSPRVNPDLSNMTSTTYGDPTVDGSWRIRINGNDLVFERRESSAWVEKLAATKD
jgi:hypothetical protein